MAAPPSEFFTRLSETGRDARTLASSTALRAQEKNARASGLLPPTDDYRIDAAFADFPEPRDRSDPRTFRFDQLPRNR
jgi:hypothetical protein